MALKQAIEAYELLDQATINGERVAALLRGRGLQVTVTSGLTGEKGHTDFIRVLVPGSKQASKPMASAPTLGIIGQLGGIGARPTVIGLVSDADGAITALACALKLADMINGG